MVSVQVTSLPWSELRGADALPLLTRLRVDPAETSSVDAHNAEAREPFLRASVDVFRISKGIEHYIGGGTFVSPKVRSTLVAPGSVSLFPTRLHFGDVVEGETKKLAFLVSNNSDEVVSVQVTSLPGEFKIDETLPADVQPKETKKLTVRFTAPATPDLLIEEDFAVVYSNRWSERRISVIAHVIPTLAASVQSTAETNVGLRTDMAKDTTGWLQVSSRLFDNINDPFVLEVTQTDKKERIRCLPLDEAGTPCSSNTNGVDCRLPKVYVQKRDVTGSGTKEFDAGNATLSLVSSLEESSSEYSAALAFREEQPESEAVFGEALFDLYRATESQLERALLVVHKDLNVFGEAFRDFITFLGSALFKPKIDRLLSEIESAERKGLDSNLLFMLRLARPVDLPAPNLPPIPAYGIYSDVRSWWETVDENNAVQRESKKIDVEVAVDGDCVLPIQRPALDDKNKSYKDWNRLRIQVTTGNTELAETFTLELAQGFGGEVQIYRAQRGANGPYLADITVNVHRYIISI